MTNRVENMLCVKCGNPLVEINPNSWLMCSSCTRGLQTSMKERVIRGKKRQGKPGHKVFKLPMLAKP